MFVNKIVFCFVFFENNKNKKHKMKFGKYKDQKIVRVRKHKDWKMYRSEEYRKVQR